MRIKKATRHICPAAFSHRVCLYTLLYCSLISPRLCICANSDFFRVRFFHMPRRVSCASYLSNISSRLLFVTLCQTARRLCVCFPFAFCCFCCSRCFCCFCYCHVCSRLCFTLGLCCFTFGLLLRFYAFFCFV